MGITCKKVKLKKLKKIMSKICFTQVKKYNTHKIRFNNINILNTYLIDIFYYKF